MRRMDRIRPALMLRWHLASRILFAEGLIDEDFLERHTIGSDQMRERAAEWTPERTSATTGIPVETIVSLARRYGRAKSSSRELRMRVTPGAGWPCARSRACRRSRATGGVRVVASSSPRARTSRTTSRSCIAWTRDRPRARST